ncbi:hypothetical protein EV384_6418 [Micromonospora kangleipakensis]|uniref:Uncharacterized protein n=1 Tax=Micromonospora kangleipakensis TaxID=1077942 RepID=A0A4Q8BHZ1_9ACTN|nr:hypothetical protein [Micromonospora kangleipakensis]RZU77680.1 hypothetical protein EV384_6418 [Micromonospora kangleipakensis]
MFGKIARHLAGATAACLVFVVQGIVIYVGLLAYALIADADIGGPLAGLLLVLLAAALGIALVPLLFVPASVAGEVAAKSGRLLAKLLVAFAVASVLATIYVVLVAVATDVPIANTLVACLLGAVAVLGPTAACVGVTHGVRKIRPKRGAQQAVDGMAKVA